MSVTREDTTEHHDETLLHYLSRELARLHTVDAGPAVRLQRRLRRLPRLRAEGRLRRADAHEAELPDACLLLADRIVAIDHELGRTHLLALSRRPASRTPRAGSRPRPPRSPARRDLPEPPMTRARAVALRPRSRARAPHGERRGVQAAARGRRELRGLPDEPDRAAPPADPFALYRVLRRVNPAPYGAYLRIAEAAVLSSSPERFLRVRRDRSIETKPIKGTARREADPQADAAARDRLLNSAKDRAEHLMIVDLLRNDLGLVSQIGSIYVAKLMDVESYETVHQLVSTIRGLLRDDVDLTDCIRATFPGGSMTGAPKLRTMEIIDDLEGGAARRLFRRARLSRAQRHRRPEHRHPHARGDGAGRDDRQRRGDRHAVRGRGRVRRDAAQGATLARRGEPRRRRGAGGRRRRGVRGR